MDETEAVAAQSTNSEPARRDEAVVIARAKLAKARREIDEALQMLELAARA